MFPLRHWPIGNQPYTHVYLLVFCSVASLAGTQVTLQIAACSTMDLGSVLGNSDLYAVLRQPVRLSSLGQLCFRCLTTDRYRQLYRIWDSKEADHFTALGSPLQEPEVPKCTLFCGRRYHDEQGDVRICLRPCCLSEGHVIMDVSGQDSAAPSSS